MKQSKTHKSIKGMTEEKAKNIAKDELETFEGNLKAIHTETHYVFKKIRG